MHTQVRSGQVRSGSLISPGEPLARDYFVAPNKCHVYYYHGGGGGDRGRGGGEYREYREYGEGSIGSIGSIGL